MITQLIVSVVGPEQMGFIKQVTLKTKELGGKWLANKITHLDGQIAGLLKLEIETSQLDAFRAMMQDFEGINVSYHEPAGIEQGKQPLVKLTLEGEDRSGLTSEITHLLYDLDVGIEHYESQRYPVIGLNTGVFEANLSLRLPETLSVNGLKSELEQLNDQLRVFVDDK